MKLKRIKGIILVLIIAVVAFLTVNALRTKDGFDKYREEFIEMNVNEQLISEIEQEYNDLISENGDVSKADKFVSEFIHFFKEKRDYDSKPVIPKPSE